MNCDIQYGEDDPRYGCCTSYCDDACVDPVGFDASCDAGHYVPDHTNLLSGIAMSRVCGDVNDYIKPTCGNGPVPDANAPTWTAGDCALWATTAIGVDPGNDASSTGKLTFTKLLVTGDWASGPCDAAKPRVQ
jgi:hypothetical protein